MQTAPTANTRRNVMFARIRLFTISAALMAPLYLPAIAEAGRMSG